MPRTARLVMFASWLIAVPAYAQTTLVAPPAPPPPPAPPAMPAPPAPPPAPLAQISVPSAIMIRGGWDQQLEKGPYLGVTTSPVPPVLRDQLRLRPGLGLVVDFVRPDSPAAAAGLKKNDILEKLDDQLLVSNQQLAILVRMHKAGEELKLSIIREAQPQTLGVTLAEGDIPPLDQVPGSDGMQTYRAIKMLQDGQNSPRAAIVNGGGFFGGGANGFNASARWDGDPLATYGVVWSDKEHTLEISQDKANGRHLVAKDKSGKVIFDGPIATDEQVEKLPDEIRDKVKKIKVTRLQPPTTSPVLKKLKGPLEPSAGKGGI